MRFSNDMLVLGTNSFNSTKNQGKVYYEVNFLDGNKACDVLCEDVELWKAIGLIPSLTKCHVDFSLTIGRYIALKVVGLHILDVLPVPDSPVPNASVPKK